MTIKRYGVLGIFLAALVLPFQASAENHMETKKCLTNALKNEAKALKMLNKAIRTDCTIGIKVAQEKLSLEQQTAKRGNLVDKLIAVFEKLKAKNDKVDALHKCQARETDEFGGSMHSNLAGGAYGANQAAIPDEITLGNFIFNNGGKQCFVAAGGSL